MDPRTMGADQEVISCTYDWGIPSWCDEHAVGSREIKRVIQKKEGSWELLVDFTLRVTPEYSRRCTCRCLNFDFTLVNFIYPLIALSIRKSPEDQSLACYR